MNDSTLDYWIRTIIYEIQTPFNVALYAIRNFVRTLHVDPFVALSTVAAVSLLVAAVLIVSLVAQAMTPRQQGKERTPTGAGDPSGTQRDSTTRGGRERGA
ncbi:MAG TPA: hypothetical protein VJT33_01765 [bacterium]|nr:hypothetical protein [bacterium]